MSTNRRFFVAGAVRAIAAAAGLSTLQPWAAQRRSLDDPMHLAADDALVDSGLAARLQRAFGRDTGVAVKLLRGPASGVLQALEQGEHDAALTNAPNAESALEQQGLVHDRRLIAQGGFMLVGPSAQLKKLGAPHDVVEALGLISESGTPFLSQHDGSGVHLEELALWRAAKISPVPSWYFAATQSEPLFTQVRQRAACTLVERGAWLAFGGIPGYVDLASGDPRLTVDIHVMRSFRTKHPAAKLFVQWVAGGLGRRIAGAVPGYRIAAR